MNKTMQKGQKLLALLIVFWCFCATAVAQNIIKGVVVDSFGESVIGATVVLKSDKTVGTTTDLDGNFSLKVPSANATLVISYVGMKSVEVKATGKTLKITLEEDSEVLEDVVVVGYGQQKKASVVGAITQTTGETLARAGGVSDIGSALTGNLPGVITTASTGMPGDEDPKIVIRGASSWNSSDPLILVDGIERPMSAVDVSSVQSISVLKDASATAVYGVKGANGVILITTKRGQEGRAKIGVSFSSTMKFISKIPTTLESADALMVRNDVVERELGLTPESWSSMTPYPELEHYRNPASIEEAERYPNVDWRKELFKDVAMSYNANINLAGGTRFVKYYAAIDYQHEGDLFREWDNGRGYQGGYGYNRVNARSNLDFQLTKTTLLKANLSGSYGVKKNPWGMESNSWAESQLWVAAYSSPHDAIYPQYSDGTWGIYHPDYQAAQNSVLNLATAGTEQRVTTRINTDFTLEQDLSFITKGLKVSGLISWDNVFFESGRGINDNYNYPQQKWIDPVTGEVWWERKPSTSTGFDYIEPLAWNTASGSVQNWATQRNLYYQAQLYWARKFGKHDATAMGVFNRNEHAQGSEFANYREDWAFRATYNYADRYFVEYNGAYNGSEKFSKENRFAFFNSGALGWMISNEPWMKAVRNFKVGNLTLLDLLKVRYSYGEIGDDNVGERWLYATRWSYGGATNIDPDMSVNLWDSGARQSIYKWYKEARVGNPDIHWEKSVKQNLGIDYSFLNGLVAGSLEFFKDKRSDILVSSAQRSVPFYFGAAAPYANLGEVETNGYELEVRLNKTWKNGIHAWGNFNMTYAKNKVLKYDDPALLPAYQKTEGFSIGQAHSYVSNGFANDWDEIIATTTYNTNNEAKLPGQYIITDFNSDGVIDQNDSAPYGFTGTPQRTYSASVGVDYKGWSLYAQFYGVSNVTRYVAFNSLTRKVNTVYDEGINYWTKDNNSGIPLPRWNSVTSYYDGSRFQFDGSFVRLKNIELAYTWGKDQWIKKLGLGSLKIYVNGNNLLLWTDLPDDRESNFAGNNGTAYPTMKRINIGLKFDI